MLEGLLEDLRRKNDESVCYCHNLAFHTDLFMIGLIDIQILELLYYQLDDFEELLKDLLIDLHLVQVDQQKRGYQIETGLFYNETILGLSNLNCQVEFLL